MSPRAEIQDQPPPIANDGPSMHDLVIENLQEMGERPHIVKLVVDDMKARKLIGLARYGTMLQANNGRDAIIDAYQEAMDLCCYTQQAIAEGERGLVGVLRSSLNTMCDLRALIKSRDG